MDADRIKLVISTGLTLGAALVPGVGEAVATVGGQTEVTATVLAGWSLIHGLVHFVHGRGKDSSRRLVYLLPLLLPVASADAQGITVALNTDNPPSIAAAGQTVIGNPSAADLGRALSYPGVGDDNLQFRLYLRDSCRSAVGAHSDPNGVAVNEWYKSDAHVWAQLSDVPEDWRDRYRASGARGVQQVRRPTRTQIVSQSFQTVGLNSQVCDNSAGNDPLTCTTSLTRTVANTVSTASHWSVSATVRQEINYRVGSSASPAGVGGSTSLSFTGTYGQDNSRSETVTVAAQNQASVTVPAGKTTTMELSATHGSITAEVDYSASYEGDVVLFCHCNDGAYADTGGLHPCEAQMLGPHSLASLYDGSLPVPSVSPVSVRQVDIGHVELRETISTDLYNRARVTAAGGQVLAQ